MGSHIRDGYFSGIRRSVEWIIVLVAMGAAVAAVVVPHLTGAIPFAVLTSSMEPHYPPGTLVVVRPVDPADVTVGSVITYQPRPDDPEVVTHRVITQGFDGQGRPVLRTQGDANAAPDPLPVHEQQVVGKVWYAVPYLGYLTVILDGRQRTLGLYLVIGGLLAYALVMFLGALRDRVRRPTVDQDPQGAHPVPPGRSRPERPRRWPQPTAHA